MQILKLCICPLISTTTNQLEVCSAKNQTENCELEMQS